MKYNNKVYHPNAKKGMLLYKPFVRQIPKSCMQKQFLA